MSAHVKLNGLIDRGEPLRHFDTPTSLTSGEGEVHGPAFCPTEEAGIMNAKFSAGVNSLDCFILDEDPSSNRINEECNMETMNPSCITEMASNGTAALRDGGNVNSGPTADSSSQPCTAGSSSSEIGESLDRVPGKCITFISATSPELFKVEIKVKDKIVTAVIDSGAFGSLMSSDMATELGLQVAGKINTLQVVGGGTLRAAGVSESRFSIDGIEMNNTQFIIFPTPVGTGISLILGVDFLKANNIELCIKKRIIVKHYDDGGKVEIYVDGGGKPVGVMFCGVHCYASRSVHIDECSSACVPVSFTVSPSDPEHLLLYCDDAIDRRLLNRVHGISGIMDSKEKGRVVLFVASDSSIDVQKGQSLGVISSVLEVPDADGSSCGGSESDNDCINEIISNIPLSELSILQQSEVIDMFKKFKRVFSSGETDIGKAAVTQHSIKLSNETPIYQHPRRFPPPMAEEIERQCRELKSLDIIEPSISPWSSPVVPVRKKDGTIRLCIDYRKLNVVTVPDKFPIPNLSDSLFGLYGTKFFTRLDLVRGYYQLPIDKASRSYTAFSTPRNHWQFKRLSFGLRNAPSAFQREIQAVLSSLPSNKVIAYIDDILVMGNSYDEHLNLVSKVLQTLEIYGIKIKPAKCEFFKSEVDFLGHKISQTGIKKTGDYVDKVLKFRQPSTVGELREFLGLINFQRKFLPSCSEIQKPLSSLTGGRKSKILIWTPVMVAAFEKLKSDMQQEIELAYPDYSEGASNLELWVDASANGSGAYLAQQQDGSSKVIGFASMMFSSTQLNYSTLERELTALRWGIKTFKPFLSGIFFTLYTDHQPLVHLHNMKIVCSRLARTVEELSDFTFEIKYVPGQLNTAADALSRLGAVMPCNPNEITSPSLPDGLIIDGMPSPGGGDSMFVSLYKCLSRLPASVGLCSSESELRELLVDEAINNSSRYNLKLDRGSRKKMKLMRFIGQLPSFDLLIVASYLFKVRIFVYFWAKEPVIYQFHEYKEVIHLQCVSGIHFNPLIEIANYSPPDIHRCSINTISVSVVNRGVGAAGGGGDGMEASDSDVDQTDALTRKLLSINNQYKYCSHPVSSLPQVCVTFGVQRLCAILDTGAEISLVTVSALEIISNECKFIINDEHICDIVGFSGKKTSVMQTVELSFSIGTFVMSKQYKFAVVKDEIFPHCFLLGLDFMTVYDIDLSLGVGTCKHNSDAISEIFTPDWRKIANSMVLSVETVEPASHDVVEEIIDDLVLEIDTSADTIAGLSLQTGGVTIKYLQSHCPELRLLFKNLIKNKDPRDWPLRIGHFKKHFSRLEIQSGLIVFLGRAPVAVVPFGVVVELAFAMHGECAHVGRDKLLALLSGLVWHPSNYKIANDICTTCYQCQTLKEFSTKIISPTLRIVTKHPFELVAADLISLPKTAQGYIGCLMVVDHYSKWVAAVPIKDKRSKTIIHCLEHSVFPFLPQIPRNLLTDNGPEFVSSEFGAFLERSNVVHKLTTPYCPTSNGAVERVNRTIKNFLRSLVDEDHSWDVFLPKAIIVYNNTYHSQIKMSPAEFLLNKSHPVKFNIIESKFQDTWRIGHPKFLSFSTGQLVLMKIQHKGFLTINKLIPNFKGPFVVTKCNENGLTYQVKDQSTNEIFRVHHSQLKIYREPPKYLTQLQKCTLSSEVVQDTNCECSPVDSSFTSGSCSGTCCAGSECDSDSVSSFSGFGASSVSSQLCAFDCLSSHGDIGLSSSQRSASLCRGCQFEGDLESKFSGDVLVGSVPELTVDETSASVGNLFQSVLQWEDEDWQLSSIDSTNMIDESQEVMMSDTQLVPVHKMQVDNIINSATNVIDGEGNIVEMCRNNDRIKICKGGNPCESGSDNFNQICVAGSRPGTGMDSDSDTRLSFEGFEINSKSLVKLKALSNLRRVLFESESGSHLPGSSEVSSVRQTRSRGPVTEHPMVQRVILERKINVLKKN